MQELTYLKKQLESLLQVREERLTSGSIKSYEEYRAVVGERTGLLLSINEIEDLLKKQQEIDDNV